MFNKDKKNKFCRGLTLIELMVVLSIFGIISSITIFNYSKFNSSASILNLADDIALSVRKAQGYAIGVHGIGGTFNDGYGVHFTANNSSSTLVSGSNQSFVIFSDMGLTPNGKYDYSEADPQCSVSPSIGNECMEVLNILSADEISEIYYNNRTAPIPKNGIIDVIFRRPNPEPTFCYRPNESEQNCVQEENIYMIRIKISSLIDPVNIYKIITISNNGQISVSLK